jgi:hypothetical protein
MISNELTNGQWRSTARLISGWSTSFSMTTNNASDSSPDTIRISVL